MKTKRMLTAIDFLSHSVEICIKSVNTEKHFITKPDSPNKKSPEKTPTS